MKNSGAFSVSVVTTFSDHFFKGKIFHENFKIISKIKKDFSWKDVKEFPRVFSKKFQEFSWKDVRKEDII